MLDSYENRHGFALAFGLTVSSCLSILFGKYEDVIGIKNAADIDTFPSYLASEFYFYHRYSFSRTYI